MKNRPKTLQNHLRNGPRGPFPVVRSGSGDTLDWSPGTVPEGLPRFRSGSGSEVHFPEEMVEKVTRLATGFSRIHGGDPCKKLRKVSFVVPKTQRKWFKSGPETPPEAKSGGSGTGFELFSLWPRVSISNGPEVRLEREPVLEPVSEEVSWRSETDLQRHWLTCQVRKPLWFATGNQWIFTLWSSAIHCVDARRQTSSTQPENRLLAVTVWILS